MSSLPIRSTRPAHLILDLITRIRFGKLFIQLKISTRVIFVHKVTVQREPCAAGFPPLVCVCMCFIDINYMPHYRVILHALRNLSFSFTITFTFNNHKTVVEIHYNVDNNILTSSLIIAMANYPQELSQDAVCQSHTGHMTGLWFLPSLAFKAEY